MQIIGISVAHFDHAANAVDGRAQVVAHAAQELCLCGVGGRGLARGFGQLVAIVALLLQQIRQAPAVRTAANQHNSGYGTAVEHQNAGNDNGDGLKVALCRGIGIHVELSRFTICAQIPVAVDIDQPDLAGQAVLLNAIDNEGIRRGQLKHAQYGGLNGIGRNDLAIVFDHDIAAVDGLVAIEQALQLERVARNRLGALVPHRDNDTVTVLTGDATNVRDRIVRKRDAGAIGLKRIARHFQHGRFFEICCE